MLLSRKQLGRMRGIGSVLVKYGWGHAISRLGLAHLLRMRRAITAPMETPVRLVQALEELGPTFIKLGQLLSTRPDLLPKDYIAALSRLQDTAPTVPVQQIKSVIREELGRPVEEVYSRFQDEPLAAASLGQVHAATLQDGQEVIVKIQRPGIPAVIESDVQILYVLAKFLESRWERARSYGLTDIVDEFSITIHEELDYTREAHNAQRLKQNLARIKEARLPVIHWDLTTSRVLTMERIHGVKINDLDGLAGIGVDRVQLADNLSSIFLEQLLIDGFFHADPHPGNLLVTKDHEIVLIDTGQVRTLDVTARTGLIRLLIAFEHQDTRQFAEEIIVLGISRGDVDVAVLTHDLEKLLRQYYDLPLRSVNVGQLLMRVMDISARHKIRLPTGFTVVGKVIANIDGINRQLNPDWNLTEAVRPYISRAVREELRVEELLMDSYRALIDAKSFLFKLPEYLNQLFRKSVEGSLRVEFRHRGLEELEHRLDRVANRLAFALIVGALIIGSSLVLVANQGPTSFWGLPILGIVGYAVSSIFAMWLLISISRSGRL